ncbi:MAG: sugar ABC transporter ATP-binding protein [Clostridiales bacterium]|nr:sugar ABC transporter ATP-binding protein [Clostridiales bacterium]
MGELLRMRGIGKSFGAVRALDDVRLELNPGEVLALMGENGAGKSTLMNILSGSIAHYEGDIFIDGRREQIGSPTVARALGIAKIHQELQLVPEMSVAENMFMGREKLNRARLVNKRAQENAAGRYLDMLELNISPRRAIKALRVGEQQMVEIAKAISLNARILIMDEPTSAISKAESQQLFRVIRKLVAEGVAIIYITHRMEEVFEVADRLTVLRDGRYIDTVDARATDREAIISMMVGREIRDMYPKEAVPVGDEVLRVEHLSLLARPGSSARALKDVSFSLRRGEVLGIAGLLGAGRSEIFECLFGVHARHMHGDIYIEGKKVAIRSPRDAIDRGLSFATEDRKGKGLVLLRSIGENMSLPLLRRFTKGLFMDTAREKVEWSRQMDAMRIKAPSVKTLCAALSGGNQQKVVLGRWLITHPKVLLLDEPTRGIDVGAKAEIYQLINRLAAQGIGIIVISSELPEVIGIADRILTLCEGRLNAEFRRDEATQEKLLYAATLREEDPA